MEPEPAFIMGMLTAAFLGWVWRLWRSKGGAAPRFGHRPQTTHLIEENGALKAMIARAEERIAVLERIATDPAERTAREIESLR